MSFYQSKSLKRNLKRSHLLIINAILIGFSLMTTHLVANEQPIQLVNNVDVSANTPRQGVDMQRVEIKYGEPLERISAIGEPPITRWIYPTFTVFFEHDRVLHSVIHRG